MQRTFQKGDTFGIIKSARLPRSPFLPLEFGYRKVKPSVTVGYKVHKMKLKEYSPTMWRPLCISFAKSVAVAVNIIMLDTFYVTAVSNTQRCLKKNLK